MFENHILFSWPWTLNVIIHCLTVYLSCQTATIAVWFISDEPGFRSEVALAQQETLDKSTFEFSMDRRLAELITDIKSDLVRLNCYERGHHTPFQDSCYFYNRIGKNWTDARDDCHQRNGTLIKVSSDDEFDFLKRLIFGFTAWIGLSRREDGETWKWEADETVHEVAAHPTWWRNGQPDIPSEEEACVAFIGSSEQLSDYACSDNGGFYICEIPLKFFKN